jgi:glycosyltransferase involved in cell wall biosynthesis
MTHTLNIEAYIMVRNEEKLIPYLMHHYGQFARVIFLENNSTDNTVDLAHSLGAEVWQYDIPDEINELKYLDIKESCWQGSKADWVIVADADEFVYHPDIVNELKKSKATVIHPKFYNMFTEVFPITEGQIYDEVTMGTDGDFWLSKMNIFRPSEIRRMNWAIGCHFAHPEGNVIIDDKTDIKTLHMKFLSRQYIIDKYAADAKRLSTVNIMNGWGGQFLWTTEQMNKYFDDNKPKLQKII